MPSLTQKHNLISGITFGFKAFLFTLKRYFKNEVNRLTKGKNNDQLSDAPIVSFSESELWNADDSDSNWILTAGKIENLRIAAKKLNGIEVKAGTIFSFWKHIGKPSRLRGFVIGREIREGCIVPTIAGGLCQLSNALYDAALKAGFEVTERHKHTQVIKGSLAEHDRDATVKWNYVDLRFKPAHDFKIVTDFTPEKLLIQFKGYQKAEPLARQNVAVPVSKLNDCYSCGNVSCFKHPGAVVFNKQKQITTFILDERWPEYEQYVKSVAANEDYFIVPFAENSRIKVDRLTWQVKKSHATSFAVKALQRAAFIRLASKSNGNIPSVYLKYDSAIINFLKKAVPLKTTHIVIAQNLLPFAWQQGILWGRTFDVLMTRLPMETLQQKLDKAHSVYRDSKTLNDFRADKCLIDLENTALTKSRHIITPHQQIADIFNNKSIKLNWILPPINSQLIQKGNKVLFPASALARKGAYEMKRLAQELDLELVIAGRALENDNFWEGLNVTQAGPDVFNEVKLVILPAYIEHQPRLLLKALALNIPVIATSASGLSPAKNLSIIPEGDYEALKAAVSEVYFTEPVLV